MGVAKEPLDVTELGALDQIAARINRKTERGNREYRIYAMLRYTGMHSACLYRRESQLHVVDEGGEQTIKWRRPMKGRSRGKIKGEWAWVRGVPVSGKGMDFDIEAFYKSCLSLRKKPGAWKQYIYALINRLGIDAGIPNISPNTLRHSFIIYSVEVLNLPKGDVADMAGCSIKTIDKYYAKLGARGTARRMRDKGW